MLRIAGILSLSLLISLSISCAEFQLADVIKKSDGVDLKDIVGVIDHCADEKDPEAVRRQVGEVELSAPQSESVCSVLVSLASSRERIHEIGRALIVIEDGSTDRQKQVPVKPMIPAELLDATSIPYWRAFMLLSSTGLKSQRLHVVNSVSQILLLLENDDTSDSLAVVGFWVSRIPISKHTMISNYPARGLIWYLTHSIDEKQAANKWPILQNVYSSVTKIIEWDSERYAMYDTKKWIAQDIPKMIAAMMAVRNQKVWQSVLLGVAATSDGSLPGELLRYLTDGTAPAINGEQIQLPAMKALKTE